MVSLYKGPTKHTNYMNTKYLIKCIGIGDLIFFCSAILAEHKENEPVEYFLSKDTLRLYRKNSGEYEIFCHEYIKYFLSNYDIKILNNINETNRIWDTDFLRDGKILNNSSVIDTIKNKLIIKNKVYQDNYIVIFTKVRDLNLDVFSQVSTNFFRSVNTFEGKVVLLGERQVEYSGEYALHSKKNIYSIYQNCKENIAQNKIIDLTIENFDFNTFSLSKILEDCGIIMNSNKTYVFGGGGFFCLSLFTDKLVSLTNGIYRNAFYTKRNKNLFSSVDEFQKHLIQ